MAELNFVVDQNALDTVKNTQLSANFAEMKEALTEFIEPYTQVIVSEDAISEAKADRAKINAVAKHIDDYRKLVKKIYTEPLKQFEDQCRELVMICDQGKNNIDYQLAEFEEKRKQEKLSFLEDYYFHKVTKDNPEYITFKQALHPKWENKTVSLEECQKYINDTVQKVDKEVNTIRSLHSQWETSLLDEYSRTHDLLSALALNERLTEKAQQEAERKRKEQEERGRRQAELERQRAEAKEAVAEAAENMDWGDAAQYMESLYGADLEADLQKAINADKGTTEPEPRRVYVGHFIVRGDKEDLYHASHILDEYDINYTFSCEEVK